MRASGGLIFLITLLPLVASAQTDDHFKSQGYVYFAPGVEAEGAATAHIGGGGEWFFSPKAGIGAELGYIAALQDFRDGIGTFSPNLVALFRPNRRETKVRPFFTGGYTLFFRNGAANGVNLGGGVNYWFNERCGLRFEVRDNFVFAGGESEMSLNFRIGLTFR